MTETTYIELIAHVYSLNICPKHSQTIQIRNHTVFSEKINNEKSRNMGRCLEYQIHFKYLLFEYAFYLDIN